MGMLIWNRLKIAKSRIKDGLGNKITVFLGFLEHLQWISRVKRFVSKKVHAPLLIKGFRSAEPILRHKVYKDSRGVLKAVNKTCALRFPPLLCVLMLEVYSCATLQAAISAITLVLQPPMCHFASCHLSDNPHVKVCKQPSQR